LKFIIDGYNLMGSLGLMNRIKEKEIVLGEARKKMLNLLLGFNEKSYKDYKMEVVFDGRGIRKSMRTKKKNKIKIRFASRKETADHFITRIADEECLVVTEDRELEKKLKEGGIEVMPNRIFLKGGV